MRIFIETEYVRLKLTLLAPQISNEPSHPVELKIFRIRRKKFLKPKQIFILLLTTI
jgi:hypothetical protein